mmetsp:Transcript_17838/g.49405  ORF Transcript_17838/g.49405 Transcript_17838/m.49405 type:complete len:213 (+) Transcript_17838:176-814(+)
MRQGTWKAMTSRWPTVRYTTPRSRGSPSSSGRTPVSSTTSSTIDWNSSSTTACGGGGPVRGNDSRQAWTESRPTRCGSGWPPGITTVCGHSPTLLERRRRSRWWSDVSTTAALPSALARARPGRKPSGSGARSVGGEVDCGSPACKKYFHLGERFVPIRVLRRMWICVTSNMEVNTQLISKQNTCNQSFPFQCVEFSRTHRNAEMTIGTSIR